ncbi:MAG: hypothetical protein PHD95_06005 [Candidatus ainarchaeum sp.]|nr:hypothetical protein [Candidatus ainarchaeum sp.]
MLSNWQRAQILKKNAVRIKFKDLNPVIQEAIGSLRTIRVSRGLVEVTGLEMLGYGIYAALSKKYAWAGGFGSHALVGGLLRTKFAQAIQETHIAIAETAKTFGLLQTQNEKAYPPDWINPAVVAETHPIFSVTRNGDIIFRRVTPLEFKLLKAQEGWRGKAGLNVSLDPRKLLWRWRGTLRKPKAPEVECRKVSERLRQLLERMKPVRVPKPALQPVTGKFFRRRLRH